MVTEIATRHRTPDHRADKTERGEAASNKATILDPVSNDAAEDIAVGLPYTARVTIRGNAALLFHRWSNEAVAEKAAAAKGSKAKKSDNIESYLYRCDNGHLGLPGEYLRQSIVSKREGAARYRQDPRSPRKSAVDLFAAGIVSLTEAADLGVPEPEYIDRRRVVIRGSAITRERPALKAGWEATVELMVLLPEYIDQSTLHDVLTQAGRFVGVGDFRPTYGRFQVVQFKV